MHKVVNFWPQAIGLSIKAENSALQDLVVVKLEAEEIDKIKSMREFSLTKLRSGSRSLILGNQSEYVIITSLQSRLFPEEDTSDVFARYREHNFDRENPEHEFLG